MTTRLIEECFDLEETDWLLAHCPVWIYDPSLISKEELKKLRNPTSGQIIRSSQSHKKLIHSTNYGFPVYGRYYDFRSPPKRNQPSS